MGCRRLCFASLFASIFGSGCMEWACSPIRNDAYINCPITIPDLPPAPVSDKLPEVVAAKVGSSADQTTLDLSRVIASLRMHFPLLLAVEQERAISAGLRLAAEGQFDLNLRARGSEGDGTFSNGRLDVGLDQPTPISGISTFAGWRLGQGNFPIYYGDRKTGDGGEFRAGLTVPLLQNRDIDPRRARLRAAQIAEQTADPVIRRAVLDYQRSAAAVYWTWVAAGAQYRVAEELLGLARSRQTFIDEQRAQQLVAESVQVLNRRLIAAREEQLVAAERAAQSAAIRLSLFFRDDEGQPIAPAPTCLPPRFMDQTPPPPAITSLKHQLDSAIATRPELLRFRLLKERLAVDLQLADNQASPQLNVFASAAQDIGFSKKTFTGVGPFRTDRTNSEVGATLEVPLQRRDAVGRTRAIQAQIAQVSAQERFARDEIVAQVQDAVSELERMHERLGRSREELVAATRVRDLESESFRAGRISLIDLNLQEVAAAEAQTKVIANLAAYYRALAEYAVAIGNDVDR